MRQYSEHIVIIERILRGVVSCPYFHESRKKWHAYANLESTPFAMVFRYSHNSRRKRSD